MHVFYTPDINSGQYVLNEEESNHCIKVLRLQKSAEIFLIDGLGGLYKASIIEANPKKTLLSVNERHPEFGKRNHYLHIAVAPTKNIERTEWFLEKATEIGIDEISFIITDRSERKDVKIDRLNKVITSAIKQSLKAYHPKLNAPLSLKRFLDANGNGQKFIAHCMNDEKITLKDGILLNSKYLILIGPEGDFTEDELIRAKSAGYKGISLGESRLRTETAALQACFEVNFLNR